MAAYAALVSLMQIFNQIEHHPSPPISLNRKQVESLTETVVFLQEFLEGYKSPFVDSDEADPLEMRIADAAHAAEDAIESHIVDQILSPVSLYDGLVKMIEHMDLIMKKVTEIVAVKDQLRRLVSACAGSSKSVVLCKLIQDMDLMEKKMLECVAFKDQQQQQQQVSESACSSEEKWDWIAFFNCFRVTKEPESDGPKITSMDLYESLVKVIESMDLIMKEAMEIVALKDQLERQVSASASAGTLTFVDLHERMMKMIEHMDWIKKEALKIVAVKCEADSSTSADFYESLIEDVDLIKKEVMEIVTNLCRQRVLAYAGSSTSAYLYECMMLLAEYMDLIKKEVMESVTFKDQLQRQVSAFAGSSTSADLYESLVKMIVDMDLIENEVSMFVAELNNRVFAIYSSISADLYKHMRKLTEKMTLINKEVMEILAVNEQLQIQVSPFSRTSTSAGLYESLVKVIEDMDLIKNEVMEIVGGSSTSKMLINTSLKSSLSKLNSTTMVGFKDVMLQLLLKLTNGELGRQVIPIVGMGGIGKTTLTTNVYAQVLNTHYFDICVWVAISQQFNAKELLGEILSQANKANKEGLSRMSEDETGVALHQCLLYRRYLIVLDDMWSIEAWEKLQRYCPDNSNGSRIMVTTRLSNLGYQLNINYCFQMNFLDEESSWNVFSKIVFSGGSCPLELKEIAKKILKSCKGLPLSIVVVGGLLEKLEPTKECWESIMRSINSLVNLENDKHCLKILKLSYNHLPVYLKPCYLYMGTYKEDSKIRISRVIKLWVSEGFLKPISGKSLETIAKEYLDELVDRNLILVHEFGKTGNMKYLKIHDLLRDLCLREAEKERFYHVVGKHSPQGMCSQRCVIIPRSTSEEIVVDVMKSTPYARSYISDDGRVQPLPNLKLLRILKASPYKKHRYSPEKMINLQLLDVYSGDDRRLPSSINLLWSLQTLIGFHWEEHNDAPVEIWNMSQLRHVDFLALDIYGRGALHLPDPPSDNIVVMENLQTLKGVKNFKCDEMMVRRIPNIRKLGLIGSRDDANASLHNIHHLQKLESLSYESFYGRYSSQKLITFPHSLKSLTLGIRRGRMEDILKKISRLPLLQKLKFAHGDFTTGKWETVEGQFLSLKYLSLDSCYGLEWWMMESSSHFPCLEHLHLSFLKDLKEIPAELGEIPTLKSMALEYCTESAVKSAKIMVEEQEDLQGELSFKVAVRLREKNEELQRLANPNFLVTVS